MSALHDIVLTRLADSGHANASWALLLLAALDGESTLTAFLERAATSVPSAAPTTAANPQPKPETPGV
ncbi:MAG: hypothetical protein ABMA15_11125, partial [Vicinamibacterales bacterium]